MHLSILSAIISLSRVPSGGLLCPLGRFKVIDKTFFFCKLKEVMAHPLRIHDPFSKGTSYILFKFLLQSFVTLPENVRLIMAFIPCQRW